MGIGRDILYGAGALVTSPLWGISLLRTGKWRTDWAGRFGKAACGVAPDRGEQSTRKRLLIYGVSVGEVNLVRNLVAELEQVEGLELVIAASTNTGFARATALYADRHAVLRFPYDFSFAVNRFLDAVKPDAVALVELELWPNFMDACAERDLPVAVVNGRLTARSFKGYRKIRRLIGPAFAKVSFAAVQTADYAERFIALGTPEDRVQVFDTMKWDTAVVEDTVAGAEQLAEELGIDRSKPLVVAGSTAPGEEQLLLDACPPDAQLLIAPRKPEWFDDVIKAAPDAVRRTAKQPAPDGQRVFLLDTIGELRMAYSLADVCVVGRSFTGELYGSDMMEPIALGKPTIIGPHFSDFADTMKALTDAGGIVVSDRPSDAIAELLKNKTMAAELADAGRAVILSRQGSTKRHADMLLGLLQLESQTTPGH
ncbi:3-deoxy-D-manno-octulosonic acid transferase [Algisphaera agarilytica]|uniref:3-deoxy-D-manno-octulosonic acid transferase n=1 Tax=Algisphaera agarilytica TaxID=1385975 RepID=A0A7X0H7C4_9BACT|nr:glycosyltransferase N-terminal domain-containing protein [Algisphaera agarilytica]MBB6430632.1 3-deoxy-D-manno-octulosonic-acid transferase [Algisphaera agarilytica]